MAKSAWKLSQINLREIYMYLKEYMLLSKDKNKQIYGYTKNTLKINRLNYMYKYIYYQGNTFVKRRYYIYHLRSISFCFLKFRKPFWFRSKKNK